MLLKGGNAVDAARAATITLTVVEPLSNGIGGLARDKSTKGTVLPTLLTHAAVAGAAGLSFAPKGLPARFWVLSAFCSMIPDADVVGFAFGIPYGHPFGHRGFFHSPFFGLLLGMVVVFLFFREVKFLSPRWVFLTLYFSCLTASHGILDAFTNGGLGIALLAPFDHGRYFFPWTPIVVSPIGIQAMFSKWGLRVMVSEMTWIWLPSLMLAIVSRLVRSRVAGPKPSALDSP